MRHVLLLLALGSALPADGPSLVFATYLGGGGGEALGAVAADAQGNIYVAGRTDSADFPVKDALQPVSRAFSQLFLAKFSPSGDLLWSTYYGGSDNDAAVGIATDPDGNVYVTGNVHSRDFPVQNAFQGASGGAVDAFVLKLDAAGNVVYATYLGGSANDLGMGIAADAQGNAYVTGRTESRDFPVTPGAFQTRAAAIVPDAFVTKLDPAGNLVYSTYLGGNDGDVGWGIAVDQDGEAHVAGETSSFDFPVTEGAFQPAPGRRIRLGMLTRDAFLTKLSADGSSLIYSTYLGGPGDDTARAVALDASGNAYITGITTDARLPIVGGAQAYLGGDVYLVSSDGGNRFSARRNGLAAAAVTAIALDAALPGRLYAGTPQGVFRSDDGGGTWTAAGLDGLSILQLASDPSSSGTLYAGTDFGGGLFASTDGGDTWTSWNEGLPGAAKQEIHQIAVDPSGPGAVYVVAGGPGLFCCGDQPLYRVSDGGATWMPLGHGIPSTPGAIAVNPGDATLYAGTRAFFFPSFFGSGPRINQSGTVYRRVGDAWQGSAIDDDIQALGFGGGALYAAGRQFYRSADGGATWTSTALPSGGSVVQVAADLRYPSRIYGLQTSAGQPGNRLLRSDDGGDTWAVLGNPLLGVIAVSAFDSALHAGASASASAYIAEFDPAGTLRYSTFWGDGHADRGDGIAVDASGNVDFIGFRWPGGFPNAYEGTALLARDGDGGFSLDLGASTTATVLEMPGRSLTAAPDGSIIAVMIATAPGLPVVNAVQSTLNGPSDIYVTKWK